MNKKWFRFFICYVFLVVVLMSGSFSVMASDFFDLSLTDTIDFAIKASEDYSLSNNSLDKIKFQHKEVKAALYPQVSLESSWQYNSNFPGNLINDFDASNAVSVDQLLWAFGRVRSAVKIAEKTIMVNTFNKNATGNEVVYNAKYAYYTTLLAEETFSIVKASYDNVIANKKILEDRSAKGRVSKRDNIKISADLAARIPEVNSARAQLKAAYNTLKVVIGADFNAGMQLLDRFFDSYSLLQVDELVRKMLKNEPSLKSLKESIVVQDYWIKQRKAEHYPTLSAFGSYSFKGGGDDYDVNTHNLDSYGVLGIKAKVPLFTGGEISAKVHQAKIDREAALLRYDKLNESLLLNLRNAVSDYNEYVNNLNANNNAVALAQQSFELFRELFSTGQVSVNDLNDVELQVTNQKLARLQTLFNINVTLAQIEKLTNGSVYNEND